MNKKPNILFLMSDQHRYDVSGFYGNKIIKTPNLDKLARDAVVFDNCYTPSPVCIPARQAMMSGKLPWNCGCRTYGDDLESGTMTFARKFSQYAYKTVCCGKLHHSGTDQNQGWTQRIGFDNEVSGKFIEGFKDEELKKYPTPTESQWWPWTKEVQNAGVGESPYYKRDKISITGAKQFLEEHFVSPYYNQKSSRPILLKVSINSPHYPYLTDKDKFSYYLDRVNVYHKEEAMDHPVVTRDWDQISSEVTEDEVRRATAAYYGQIEEMDALFGEVIDYLVEIGQDIDDWLIIYTSDHGDMIGEHGLWMKYKYYEASAKVPFFVRFPKNYPAKRIDKNINLCDLFASLCDIADIPYPDDLDSNSIVPLLEGNVDNWGDLTISQLDDTCMIKKGSLKYQYPGEGYKEILFDLSNDPNEKNNLIDNPNYAKDIEFFRKKLQEML